MHEIIVNTELFLIRVNLVLPTVMNEWLAETFGGEYFASAVATNGLFTATESATFRVSI